MDERKHRILGGGVFEERVYVEGRLVDVRRFVLGEVRAVSRPVLAHQGRRVA